MRRKATIRVIDTWRDDWSDRSFDLHIKMGKPTVKKIDALTTEKLLQFMKNNCVGKCTTNRKINYLIPILKIGKFSLSLQCAYYVWSKRDDENTSHDLLITEREFAYAVPSVDSLLDIGIWYNKVRLTMDQMTLNEVIAFLKSLINNGHGTLYV